MTYWVARFHNHLNDTKENKDAARAENNPPILQSTHPALLILESSAAYIYLFHSAEKIAITCLKFFPLVDARVNQVAVALKLKPTIIVGKQAGNILDF
jgi:hypothetical protein